MATSTTEIQTATLANGKKALFESRSCSRCGGCGQYGPRIVYGGRCFKCSGSGVTLTKRGEAASAFYHDLLSKRSDEIAPGDKVLDPGVPGFTSGGWRVVVGVEGSADGYLNIACENYGMTGVAPDAKIRVARTGEFKRDASAKARAYQATLTKSGQPRKR